MQESLLPLKLKITLLGEMRYWTLVHRFLCDSQQVFQERLRRVSQQQQQQQMGGQGPRPPPSSMGPPLAGMQGMAQNPLDPYNHLMAGRGHPGQQAGQPRPGMPHPQMRMPAHMMRPGMPPQRPPMGPEGQRMRMSAAGPMPYPPISSAMSQVRIEAFPLLINECFFPIYRIGIILVKKNKSEFQRTFS